jgi:hypothetical protein
MHIVIIFVEILSTCEYVGEPNVSLEAGVKYAKYLLYHNIRLTPRKGHCCTTDVTLKAGVKYAKYLLNPNIRLTPKKRGQICEISSLSQYPPDT